MAGTTFCCMSKPDTRQSTFSTPLERSKEVLRRCSQQYDPDEVVLTVSGGTDSVVAADVFARFGPEVGLKPDRVLFVNTGTAVPQTRLVAQLIAEMHGLEFHEEGYRNQRDSLAARVLQNGWPGGYGGSPATGGHGLEWANRKHKPMDEAYVSIDGFQVWGSGARKLESKNRSGNLPDSGIEQDKPRRAWCSVIGGWTTQEKREYIKERGLPVSETYLLLGFSGECTACSFDNQGLLTGIDLLCPELAHCIRSLTVWVYQRQQRGDIDIDPKRICWGWEPNEQLDSPEYVTQIVEELTGVEDGLKESTDNTAQEMVGCDPESCGGDADTNWVKDLPANQLVTRDDVIDYWNSGELPSRFPV